MILCIQVQVYVLGPKPGRCKVMNREKMGNMDFGEKRNNKSQPSKINKEDQETQAILKRELVANALIQTLNWPGLN